MDAKHARRACRSALSHRPPPRHCSMHLALLSVDTLKACIESCHKRPRSGFPSMRSITRSMPRRDFFYQDNQLTCESSHQPRRLIRATGRVVAEDGCKQRTKYLLQCDDTNTVLRRLPGSLHQDYSPYGFLYLPPAASLAAFTGQRLDPFSNCYALGNGHRYYSPRLMRFLQADTLSPFRQGGINAYSYCQGDPINREDPNGQWWHWLKRAGHWVLRQLPTFSVQTTRGAIRPGIGVHRMENPPNPDRPHIGISITLHDDDIGFVNDVIATLPRIRDTLENEWVPRVGDGPMAAATGVIAGYGAFAATGSLFAEGAATALGELGVFAFLRRGDIRRAVEHIRESY